MAPIFDIANTTAVITEDFASLYHDDNFSKNLFRRRLQGSTASASSPPDDDSSSLIIGADSNLVLALIWIAGFLFFFVVIFCLWRLCLGYLSTTITRAEEHKSRLSKQVIIAREELKAHAAKIHQQHAQGGGPGGGASVGSSSKKSVGCDNSSYNTGGGVAGGGGIGAQQHYMEPYSGQYTFEYWLSEKQIKLPGKITLQFSHCSSGPYYKISGSTCEGMVGETVIYNGMAAYDGKAWWAESRVIEGIHRKEVYSLSKGQFNFQTRTFRGEWRTEFERATYLSFRAIAAIHIANTNNSSTTEEEGQHSCNGSGNTGAQTVAGVVPNGAILESAQNSVTATPSECSADVQVIQV